MIPRLRSLFIAFREVLLRPYARVRLLRLAAMVALLLAFLDPATLREIPDPQAYRIAVLADNSGSMDTPDAPRDQTRREQMRRWLAGHDDQDGLLESLRSQTDNIQVSFFSEQTRPWDGRFPPEADAGSTALGRALQRPLQEATTGPDLGAVVLLSDGINHLGPDPVAAARRYADAGIPVSVVGFGSPRQAGDLSVEFQNPKGRLEENASETIGLSVRNRFDTPQSTRLRFFRGNEELAQRSLDLPPDSESVVEFTYTAGLPGVETLRAVLDPVPADRNPATDTAYGLRRIVGDGVTDVLYLAHHPGWEFRLLRVLADQSDSLRLHSVVRVDEDRYFRHDAANTSETSDSSASAPPRSVLSALPEDPSFYLDKDLILLDSATLRHGGDVLAETLIRFVGTRGGGCLLIPAGETDPMQDLPADLLSLFPVRETSPRQLAESAALRVETHPLFSDQIGGPLLASPPPTIPAETTLHLPLRFSRAARQPVRLLQESSAVLAIQAYGAGRTAYLAAPFAWTWALASDRGADRHQAFYQGLLAWLATGGKERLQTPLNAQLLPLGREAPLDVQLLGADYEPRMDARVTATITPPQGESVSRRLQPDLGQPGQYRADYEIKQPGAYRVEYSARFPNGEELMREAWFSAAPTGPELMDVRPREQLLRDIARLTGGRFLDGADTAMADSEFPVAAAVPRRTDRFSWTRTWPFLLLAAALFVGEWWLRRRIGLR